MVSIQLLWFRKASKFLKHSWIKVKPEASEAELKKAYRKLAMKWGNNTNTFYKSLNLIFFYLLKKFLSEIFFLSPEYWRKQTGNLLWSENHFKMIILFLKTKYWRNDTGNLNFWNVQQTIHIFENLPFSPLEYDCQSRTTTN